jgi:hypothetical protein
VGIFSSGYQYQQRSVSTWKVTSDDILVDIGTGPSCNG